MSNKKYYIKTFGCQANVADSGTIAGVLESLGFEKALDFKSSNLFIVNTCSVRQKSEDKVYGISKILKEHTALGGSKPFVVMAGCMVGSVTGERQRYAFEELKRRTPWVDEYINPSQIVNIPQILLKRDLIGEWATLKFDPKNVIANCENKTHAFVNISNGCDNFCTFCVVPYARGKEVSRDEHEILKEIKHYVLRGYSHITLCGQNVNSWGLSQVEKFEVRAGSDQKLPFADLLRKIHKMDGVEKINFISSNPFDFTNDLIEVLKLPKISDYLHIAVQSGNDEILAKMNRRHSVEDFVDLVGRIRQVKPDIELGTDAIVGFPGETEEQFMDTVKLFKKIKFNVAFISMYSPRKGTPAERFFKDDITLFEKRRRHAYLTRVLEDTKKS